MNDLETATLISAITALVGTLAAVVSTIFAGIAIHTQRSAQRQHVTVKHSVVVPIWLPGQRSEKTSVGDRWFLIEIHNDRLLPVTIMSAGLRLNDGGHVPFMGAPDTLGGVGDDLPKLLGPGEHASLYLAPLVEIARIHLEHGATRVSATLADDATFYGPRVSSSVFGAVLEHSSRGSDGGDSR